MFFADEISTTSIALLLAFSFLAGLKHATEPDHVAAVSTIVSDRKNIWSSSLVGGLWGVGHTIALLIAGIAVVAFHFEISERLANILELGVGVMLLFLGAQTLWKVYKGGSVHAHLHSHGKIMHVHPHVHDAAQVHAHAKASQTHHGLKLNPKPLFVGLIHGLAGSGALMLLILATISSPTVAVLYILIFGVGSIGGMMLMSMVIGLPFHFTAGRFVSLDKWLRSGAGLFSLTFGIIWIVTLVPEIFG
ncbi:MAG: urease accessory protein UreH [Acidobacteria bacterium]|nr:urease accessory protein UreH [Acidobacteriota bacterium]